MTKYLQLPLLGLSLALSPLNADAAPTQFDFKDPKGVNTILFKTDAPLESINGTATGISGEVAYDPAAPASTAGKITVAASSLHVGNPMQKEHLHSDKWLDVAKYPDITFEVKSLKNVKTEANVTTADANGTFTLHGVSKEITIPVKLTYLKDKLKARTGKDGDLLVIRSNFTIKRSDFGINKGTFEDKVSDEIELTLSLAGAAPKGS
jgi:polyisoprenoid-binding protein YceI